MRFGKTTLAAIAFATFTAAHAQTSSPAPTLQVYSRETVVDVTVTDAKGQPVHGLKQSDFMLKEDGKPQPIRSFKESSRAAPATMQTLAKLPPNVHTNLQPPPASSAVNILLLDFVNTAPGGAPGASPLDLPQALQIQHMVKQDAVKYLHAMPVGTRVAVLGITWPGSLRVLQGVTSDPALLAAAVDTLDYVTEGISMQRVDMTLELLPQIASVASRIQGRKNLIWFTYGLAVMTDQAVIQAKCPRLCPNDWPQRYQTAFGLLTAAQVTVYPIGARGVYNAASWEAGEEVMSLENLAEAGGGIAYHDSNDLVPGIARAIENGSDFYTLTYVPPGTEYDGRHHTIDVKLNLEPAQPGLHLTYRNYYYAEDPAKMLPTPGLALAATPASGAGDLHAEMGRAMPTSTQLLFDVRVQPTTEEPKLNAPRILGVLDAKLKSKPLTRYDFLFLVPVQQITFANGPDGTHIGSAEFDIAAYDAEGKPVTSLDQTMQFPLSAAEYQQFIRTPFQFFQQLDLPPGQIFLRIGVLDGNSKKIGTFEMPLTVTKPAAE